MPIDGDILKVFVQGKPVPQGSLNPMPFKRKNGKLGVNVFQKPELVKWRDKIADEVKRVKEDMFYPKETPVFITLKFRLFKPKTSKREYPCCKGIDLDKACRAVLDALSGVIYDDDCQVCSIIANKCYVKSEDEQGVIIYITGFKDKERERIVEED